MEVQDRLAEALSDRYRIERELGAGGMATVYLATDIRHDRKVALKVLDPELAQSLGAARFLREVKLAANLTHPHILPVHDSGESEGFLYYVMPFVKGETLRARLVREGQLPVDDAIRITQEIADALTYAHEEGVVHRDVKPANIMLEVGHAVLADFGIARAVADVGYERLTRTGTSLGTPAYMSPEQAAGDKLLDGRADQYALGCVLYEMLAGAPPFSGPQAETVIRQHLTVDPRPITAVRTAASQTLGAALGRALEKSPADRFRTRAEFATALAGQGPTQEAQREMPRTRAPRWGMVGIIVVLVVLGSILLRDRLGIRTGQAGLGESQQVVVLPFDNQTGDPELDPMGRWVAEWITEALSSTGEVHVVPALMVLEALARIEEEEEVTGREIPVRRVAATADATIAVTGSFYRRGSEIELHSEVVDLVTGRPLGVVDPTRGPIEDPIDAIGVVQDQVMGVLATRLNRTAGWEVPSSIQPPIYEAFQHYSQGGQFWIQGRYGEAAESFRKAYEADTTFLRALLISAAAYGNAGDRPAVDSLFDFLHPRRDRLAPYDRYRLEFGEAGERGDHAGRLRAARAGVALVPSGTLRLGLVIALRDTGRPLEAMESLDEVWEDALSASPGWPPLWQIRVGLLHLLGDHEDELSAAREAVAAVPGSISILILEAQALAALGRMEELRTVVDEIQTASGPQNTAVGANLAVVVEELRAHGFTAGAMETAGQALAWLRSQPAEFATGPAGRELEGTLHYLREDWEGAAEVFDALAAEPQPSLTVLGYQGVIAARVGDTATALQRSDTLATFGTARTLGSHTRWRARIQALLGNPEDAVALLRRAHGEGVPFDLWLHRDMDLEPLRGFPPFEQLARPKG